MNTELLLKYIQGNASDSEKVIVTNWLDSDMANMKEYLALRKLHDISIWQTITEHKSKEKNSIRVWSKPYWQIIKYAAVLLIAIIVTHYVPTEPLNSISLQSIHVPAGQRAELTLVDGTKVYLNANTTFIFPNQFSDETREVSLNGEGYFDVVSNKSKPFIVNTEKYNIKVLGTKFNLISYSGRDNFEASLFEGSVEIFKSNGSKGIQIKPDERIFQCKEDLIITPITDYNHQLWKEGIISFQDESFIEVINKLQLYFDLTIEIKNDKILNYRYTGKFRTKDGVQHILKVLQLRNKFDFKIDEKTNTITIK